MLRRVTGTDHAERRWSAPLFISLLLLVASLSVHDVIDPDVWFDLRAGVEILAGRFSHTNLFSYTDPSHPWMNTHWLYDVFLATAVHAGGIGLAVVLKSLVWLAAFGMIWAAGSGGDRPRIAAFALCLAALAGADRFSMRSEMSSFFFLAFFLLVIDVSRRTERGKWLWLLVPAQLLWTNMHAYWIAGPAVLCATAAGAWAAGLKMPFEWRKALAWDKSTRKTLTIVAAMCLLIPIANPYGISGAVYPLGMSQYIQRGDIYRELIAESLGPFGDWGMLRDDFIYVYILFIALAAVSCMMNLRRVNVVRVAMSAAFLVVSFRVRRAIPLFTLFSTPMIIENLGGIKTPRIAKPVLSIGIVTAMIAASAWAVSGRLWTVNNRRARFGIGPSPYVTPLGAGDFIERAKPSGPVFNNMDAGGYLAYRFQPDFKVFIDGRLEAAYSEGVFREYLQALQGGGSWLNVDDKYKFGWVLLNPSSFPDQVLIRYLRTSPDWKLVYADWVSIISVRRSGNPDIPELDLPGDLDKLPAPPVDRPWGLVSMGQALEMLGLPGRAISEYKRAEELFPGDPNAPDLMGRALFAMGKRDEAMAAFERAAKADPRHMPALYDLGTAYLMMGKIPEGAAALERAVDRAPGFIEARMNLAGAYFRMGKKDEAVRQLEEILERDPGNAAAQKALQYMKQSQ